MLNTLSAFLDPERHLALLLSQKMESLPFVGFNTLHQQHGGAPGASPQRIGVQLQQQQHQQQCTSVPTTNRQGLKAPSGAEEMQRLANEYQEEAARLADILALCGIQQQSLSWEAQHSLKLLVQLACALHMTQTTPQVLLAAWSLLLVKQGKAVMLQRKLQRERAALVQKRATAQQKLSVLQQVLAEVQAGQAKEAKHAAHMAKLTRQAQEKQAGYQAQMDKLRNKLERSGFKQEVSHSALLERHAELQGLQQRLSELQSQLNKYHSLPASLLGARLQLDEAKASLAEKQTRFRSQLDDDSFV